MSSLTNDAEMNSHVTTTQVKKLASTPNSPGLAPFWSLVPPSPEAATRLSLQDLGLTSLCSGFYHLSMNLTHTGFAVPIFELDVNGILQDVLVSGFF